MAQITDNPLTRVYDRLWQMLESDANFTALVKVGNRIKLTDDVNRDAQKKNVITADMPEVQILCENIDVNLNATSSTTEMLVSFIYVMSTGDDRWSAFMGKLLWIWICSCGRWTSELRGLRWDNKPFVGMIKPSAQIGRESPIEGKKLPNGFIALARLDVTLSIEIASMTFEEGTVFNQGRLVTNTSPPVTNL